MKPSFIRMVRSAGTEPDPGERTYLRAVTASSGDADGESGIAAARNPVVLVIDDERTQRLILRETLERDGFSVEEAENGFQGLEVFDRARPDLVLLDVRMPVMDGFAACAALRGRDLGDAVPIVMLTVLGDAESIDRAYEAGATDFITKPVAWQILGRRLRYMLRASEAFRELARSESDLHRRVAHRTAELDASYRRLEDVNRELEAFAYSVSHDLRAPLRAIGGYVEVLLQNLPEGLDAQSADYLRRIGGARERMSDLIDDLLDLSVVARHDIRRQDFDMSALALEIAESLGRNDLERPVAISVQSGMGVRADMRLLRIVLENLLGNARKFTARTPAPRIEVGTLEAGETIAYFVRDNGAGFDMNFADKLFAPFQRLHSRSEFEGNGIGLAIVSRIISRHGGRIWAEAAPDRGATFYFTLA